MRNLKKLPLLLLLFPFAASANRDSLDYGTVQVVCANDSVCRKFVGINHLYFEGADTLDHVKFWRQIINLSPDTGLLCLGHTREVVGKITVKEWGLLSDAKQSLLRDSIRKARGLDSTVRVLFSRGRNDFYDVKGVVPQIDKAIPIFEEAGVDPFYAQAILLIESPGKMLKSNVGAYGSFQLMKGVAIKMGLTVNKKVDERRDFDKSAGAAAKLIRTICVPYTNAMLQKHNIAVCETDLWYRLLVLHVYHAGAGNVDKALDAICPEVGNMQLIKTLWNTQAGAFGKHSQNYSQVALASLLELELVVGKSIRN